MDRHNPVTYVMLHFVARAINASAVAPGYLGNNDWSIPTPYDGNRYGHILMDETIHAGILNS
jgi:hypothetical protein